MSGIEELTTAIIVGTAAVASIFMTLTIAFTLWLRRQPKETRPRWQARMTHFNEQSLNLLSGTVSAFAVVVVAYLVLSLIGVVILAGLALSR